MNQEQLRTSLTDGRKVGFKKRHYRFRRQLGGGGVMILAEIVENKLVYSVLERVKFTSASCCQLLELALLLGLENLPLKTRRRIAIQHDIAPPHSVKATQAFCH